MNGYAVAVVEDAGASTAALVVSDTVYRFSEPLSSRELMNDWTASRERLDDHARRGDLDPIGRVGQVPLRAPVQPRNLYMAGANYADHAREMRGLGPDDPVPKPARGPFMFLKPTSTVIGDGDEVKIAPGADRVDWEVELAVVIGRRGHRIGVEQALDHIAGYTVANDISVRGAFVRDDIPEAPMKFDWFLQKGWATSCPLGPWLVPLDGLPGAQDARLRLTLNGEVQQESRTSQMIFSIAEQVAFLSSVVPLLPGDVICTGTCAGVGMGQGRFLAAGDEMVAEVEGIGRLHNRVVEG